MTGSNDIVIIDEQQILNEINADRTYYGKPLGEDIYENWNPFMPMRTVATFTKRVINNVGSKPSYMNVVGGNLYVTLGGQNQIIKINPTTETVSMTINVGTNPKGFDFTPDGRYMYVANFGGSGDLSFIYPMGSYVGDPFMGLEGGILYQGADGWTPDRSDWTYDSSGNIKSKSTVEFHINEPLLNEGGYAKLTAYGTDYQYSQLEQDITNVTNYSNGNNIIDTVAERLIPDFSGNIWTPRAGEWLNSPAPHNIMICTQVSGSEIRTTAPSNKYTIYYGSYSRLEFSANAIPSGGWIEADYRAKNNIYFKTHNSSMLVAIDNGSSPNFNVSYQVDEFVPKFVALDNQVTSPFTPTADGISEQYNGLEYSVITNRASGMTVTTSVAPTSGSASLITNNFEPDELDGDTTLSPVPSSNGSITMPSGNQWVKIDLGAVYMVGKISVAHSYGLDRTYHKTKTEVSEDGVSWYTVYDSAVSGEYNEKPFYHAMHDHTHYAHFFTFGARPVRYVRDWANGWVSGDGLTSGSTSNWTEIKAYGDWQVEKGYTYPTNSPKAGQQIATNGYGFVSTDISKAYVAMNIQIEFTSWWYMTYIVGPQFGKIKIEMPTLMNSGHYLNQEAPFVNNVAHRHIMSFPPSQNIMADMMNNIEAGKHRVVIRQESGKVTLDRLRFEDFQYYNRSSLLIPTSTSATLFTRYKVISEQAKWYQGQGKQSTEGAYDTVRVNPDSGQPDYSVPIKYRVRLLAELNANGSIEERGTAYITSAIFETGKLSSHWRRSESSDMMPAHMIEHWNGSQPHNTGIQHDHLANGAVRSEKILPNAIYDYHISNYARISEFKLDLNHPTHPHGYYTVSAGAGPLGTDLYIWNDTLDFLNSMTGWAGISGNYGTGSTVARGDHKHDNLYLTLTGGTLTNTLIAKGINTSLESHFANGVYADPANGTAYGLKVSQGIATDKLNVNGSVTITGNITVTGTVDGVDVSSLNTSVTNHIGSGGSAHAIAISGGANGFIDGTNYGKLLRIQDNAINQTTADGRYYIKNQNLTIVADNTVIGTDTGAVRMGLYKKAGQSPALAVTSGNTLNLFEMNTADLTSNISGTTIMNTLLSVNSSSFTYKGNAVIHSGNFNTSTLNGHAGSGGSAHAVAISGGANGFIDGVNYGKLLRIQDNAINQATTDGRYLQITGGVLSGGLSVTGNITLTGTIDGVDVSALNSSFSTVSANVANHIGSGNTAHPLAVSGGVAGFIDGASYAKLLNIQDNATNQATSDARYLQLTGGALSGGLSVTGNVSVTGTVDGVDVAGLNSSYVTTSGNVANHIGSGGSAHPVAISGGSAGFIDGTNYAKLLNIQSSAINQTTADGRYLQLTGGALSGGLSVTGNITVTGTVDGVDVSNLNSSFATVSGNFTNHIGAGGSVHALVNATTNGFMSFGDFNKLATVATSANNYVHPSGDGNLHVPATSTTHNGNVLKAGATAGSISWASVDWSELTGKPSTFTPPIATSSVLGGVKQGANISIDATGIISGAYVVATPTADGLMSKADFSKLGTVAQSANNYVHPTGDGNLHVPANGTSHANQVLKASATAGTYSWASVDWSELASVPSTFTPSAHTHSISDLTDLSNSYYNKTEVSNLVNAKGDVFTSTSNTLHGLNTFDNAGLGIKVQPSASVGNTTKLLQINNTTGGEVFSVNYTGGVAIAGDFTVTGVQTFSGTTTVNGDYTVNGQLIVGGNSTLGDASTDVTTVNGTLKVNGTIQEIGSYEEVHRRPLYGIAGDLQFQTDSTTFDTLTDYYDLTTYALPTVQSGATRYYRLYVVYSDDITSTQATAGQKATIRIAGATNKDLDLSSTWGAPNGRRDWFSTYFTDLPTGNGNLQAKLNTTGNNLGIRWVELVAYDKF
jgi:YVTN family beta-propeller protein